MIDFFLQTGFLCIVQLTRNLLVDQAGLKFRVLGSKASATTAQVHVFKASYLVISVFLKLIQVCKSKTWATGWEKNRFLKVVL